MLQVKRVKWSGFFLACGLSVMAKAEPEFLSFYPDCGYEVVEKVVHNGMVRSDLSKTAQYYVTQRLDRLRPEILQKAQDNDIKYIVIENIKLIPVRDGAMRFRVTIEHLKTCERPHDLGGKPARYNSLGQKIFSMGEVKVGEQKTIVFEATKVNKRPDVGDNVNISLTEGVYGIPLGAPQNEIVAKFGSPSFWYNDMTGGAFLAYGRRHWLIFQDDKLIKAKYGDTLFSNELVNYFTFDDRFDDRQWIVQQDIKRGAILPSDLQGTSKQLAYENDTQTLSVITEMFLENGQQDRNHRAVGFELARKALSEYEMTFSDELKKQNQAFLLDALTNIQDTDNLEAELFRGSAVGRTSTENSKQHLLLDNATLIHTVGDVVNKIYLSGGFIKGQSLGWQFGEFHRGQNMQEVLQIAGNTGFYMDGVLTIEKGRYTMTLYADQTGEKDLLDALEISIY